jgi:hypothetical protein
MGEDFKHRTPGFYDQVWRKPFAQKVFTRDPAIGHIDISNVVHDFAIDLLRDTLVEAAIASFHMKCRNFSPFRWHDSHATVGITQNNQSVGSRLLQQPINRNDDVTYGFGAGPSSSL